MEENRKYFVDTLETKYQQKPSLLGEMFPHKNCYVDVCYLNREFYVVFSWPVFVTVFNEKQRKKKLLFSSGLDLTI